MLNTNSERHKEAKTKKSDKTRVYFQCTKPGCQYACNIRKSSDGLFRVVKWSWHTCDDFSQPKVKRSWVTGKAKEMLGEREQAKPKELQRNIKHELGVDVSIRSARKAMSKARKERDDEDAAFNKLPGLFRALSEQNPGTVADIVMEKGRLKMAFLCPGPCVQAWAHCPKIIALDGTHGSSAYQGIVLVATALDGAGQIFPIAIGFAPSETNESWRFFVEHLANALGIHDTPLTVISDRCKGLNNGVADFLPRAAHSYCAFHIRQNMAKCGKAAANFVWTVANASTEHEYNEAMATLGAISPDAQAYLAKIPKEHWVRAFFPMPRYGHVTSSIAESTNSSLLQIRKYPPTKLFIHAIRKINATFAERRDKYANKDPGDIVDNIFAVLMKNTEEGRKLEARRVSEHDFDVDSRVGTDASRTVRLAGRTCTCMLFQDLGFPCVHACSAALKANIDPRTLCIGERQVGALQAVYQFGVIPVDIETVPSMALLPPLVQRAAGRPRVIRIERRDDGGQTRVNCCTLCGQPGHKKHTCPQNYA